MPAGERVHGGGAGKLKRLLSELEEEAYLQMMAADPEEAEPFSLPLFGEIAAMWGDWQRGIPPSSEWKGRGAQNPRLLMAFAVLDRAKGNAERDRTAGDTAPARSRWEQEDPAVVEARVKDMLSRAGVI